MARPILVCAITFHYFGESYAAGDVFDDTGLNDRAIQRLLDQGYVTSQGSGGGGGLTTEQIQDMIATFLVAGTNVTLTYNDAANTLTVDAASLTREQIEDLLGASIVGTGAATVTYSDAGNSFTVDVSTEAIQDIIGGLLADSTSLDVTYDDAGNALSIVVKDEYIQDLISTTLVAGAGVTLTYNDGAGTLTVAADFEAIQDNIAAFLAAGTGITATYNDAGNVETIAVDTAVISTRAYAEAWARDAVLDGWRFRNDVNSGTAPASGDLEFNNATMSSVTVISVNETSAAVPNGLGADRSTRLYGLRAGDVIVFVDQSNPANFARFRVTGTPTDSGSHATILVAHAASSGFPLADNAPVWLGRTPGSSDVPLSLFTTKGDLVIATASGAVQRHAAGADGTIPMFQVSATDGVANVYPPRVLAYSIGGTLTVQTGPFRIYNDTGRTMTIKSVRTSVGTAPTGASLITDVNKNGTTIFTTQANRPTIAASGNTSGSVTNMNTTSWANGEYITVDIDQIGSTIAGADFVFQMELDG